MSGDWAIKAGGVPVLLSLIVQLGNPPSATAGLDGEWAAGPRGK